MKPHSFKGDCIIRSIKPEEHNLLEDFYTR